MKIGKMFNDSLVGELLCPAYLNLSESQNVLLLSFQFSKFQISLLFLILPRIRLRYTEVPLDTIFAYGFPFDQTK